MKIHTDIEKVSDWDVEKWLTKELDLTPYQQSRMKDRELIRFAPFDFYKNKKRVKNAWLRITILLFPFVWVLLFFGMPIYFIFTGAWGYKEKHIKWYRYWISSLNI